MEDRVEIVMSQMDRLADDFRKARMKKVKLPLSEMGRKAVKSVRRNFDVSGRPNTWAEIHHRTGKPLVLEGTLQNSIRYRVLFGQNFQIYSTDKAGKTRVHQWGYPPKNIKARPYMVLQVNDVSEFTMMADKAVAEHLKQVAK